MTASPWPTAVTNLVAAINLQSAVTTVQPGFAIGVFIGAPLDDQPVDEAIVIRKIRRTSARFEMVGGGGTGYLRDDFIIPVEVLVYRGGDDTTTVMNRTAALVAAVEAAIRADLTIGGAVLEAWPEAQDIDLEWTDDSTGRRGVTTVDVHCWARI